MYYNTTHETDRLKEYIGLEQTQTSRILEVFANNAYRDFTPFEIQQIIPYPITSIRRAITNLTISGYLVQVSKRDGIYGRKNFTWRLK